MTGAADGKRTVLLTGAGGPAIAGMMSVLRQRGYRIVAVDMLPRSSGFFLADRSYVVPPGNAPSFFPALRQICADEGVDAVVSVVDEELPHVARLEALGIAVIQPDLAFVNLCLDKQACMRALRAAGLNAPETWPVTAIPGDARYPLFIKPRVGRGSRGCGTVDSPDALEAFVAASAYPASGLIAQPLVKGTEFTVSVVVWRDGEVQAVVPKQIISKVGVTKLAVTRRNDRIDALCRAIQQKLAANGPFNVQLIVDEAGEPWPFEINPRFSTSITLTNACGIDELGGLVSQATVGRDSWHFSDWKEGVVMVRHTMDQFISEREYNQLAGLRAGQAD
jgi:carbamoyl-phosphate synthase large subunit